MEKNRNSNIELLRLVLMFMVVLLHFNNDTMGGAFVYARNFPTENFVLHFLESLSVCAVNCFMIVSGYFLYTNRRIKFSKVADILLIVVFYRFLNYLMQIVFLREPVSVKHLIALFLPMNYFAIFYVICYMFSPFAAKMWNDLDNRKSDILVSLLLSIFVVVPTLLDISENVNLKIAASLSPISTVGNGGGYTIVQFFVMLSLGMWLRKRKFAPKANMLLGFYIGSSLIMTLLIKMLPSLYNYCSIFTVITAVCIFLLFNKMKMQNRALNFCSKSCFAIFCIHTGGFANTLWKKYLITEGHFTTGFANTLFWAFVSVIAMFFACLVLSVLCRLFFGKIKEKICGALPEIRCD